MVGASHRQLALDHPTLAIAVVHRLALVAVVDCRDPRRLIKLGKQAHLLVLGRARRGGVAAWILQRKQPSRVVKRLDRWG
jgi:hypothetical protein